MSFLIFLLAAALIYQYYFSSKAIVSSIPVKVTYFHSLEDLDMQEEKASYLTDSGILRKVDDFSRILILNDDTRIPIDDIISINSPVF